MCLFIYSHAHLPLLEKATETGSYSPVSFLPCVIAVEFSGVDSHADEDRISNASLQKGKAM